MLEESTGNFSATRNIYDWYQTNTHVIINVMIKNLKESDVRVKLIDETLDVSCNLADGNEFNLHFNLFKSIFVNESSWTVSPSKLEIKLKKTDRKRWQSLEVIPDKNQQLANKRTSSGAGMSSTFSPKKVNTGSSPSWTSTLINNNNNLELVKVVTMPLKEPKASYDWYQTHTDVMINVHIANLSEEDVEVRMDENTLECCCNLPDGNQAKFNLNLNKPIIVEQSAWKLTLSKLEISLRKQDSGRWSALECVPMEENKVANTTVIIQSIPDKNNSGIANETVTSELEEDLVEHGAEGNGTCVSQDGEDGREVNEEDEEIEESSPFEDKDLKNLDQKVLEFKAKEDEEEGEANVDKLYREIFEKGGDEVRRAMMNKRLSESAVGDGEGEDGKDGEDGHEVEEEVEEKGGEGESDVRCEQAVEAEHIET